MQFIHTNSVSAIGCEHSQCHDVQSPEVRVCCESCCCVDASAHRPNEYVVVVCEPTERSSLELIGVLVELIAVLSGEHTQVETTELTQQASTAHSPAQPSTAQHSTAQHDTADVSSGPSIRAHSSVSHRK